MLIRNILRIANPSEIRNSATFLKIAIDNL